MSPGNDERRPGRGSGESSNSNSTTLPPYPVILAIGVVVSGRVRDRLELDVTHCPGCGALHRHRAPVEWLGGVRTASCGLRYVLRVAMPKRVAA